ncbi:MAG TPA: DUF1343 domain-containing protein [Melioribacteraceae bacterium]|nr:DUF1343 domain-containing protein [Melioribacteraceae bacterium]
MFRILFFIVFISYLNLISCAVNENLSEVKCGADILLKDRLNILEGKNIGIVTNHTAILKNGTHLVDTLSGIKNFKILALFGPEHGIRGDAPDGHSITDGKDPKTGIPVYSLYGKINKPTKEMLKDINLLIFDIQDIGARFYTFISTLFYTLQAGAENNIPVIVLDRPNPIGGINVSGNITEKNYLSFVGIAPIPIQHGLTIGELANFFNQEGLLGKDLKADLQIIKIENWNRKDLFSDTDLKWINPSPNMVNLDAAMVYPGLCLLEGTNISEGRGTDKPFLTFGAPYINNKELIQNLEKYKFEGIKFLPVEYTPVDIPNMASNPKYKDNKCFGIQLAIDKSKNFDAVKLGITIIYEVNKLYPEKFEFRKKSIDRLYGSSILEEYIRSGKSLDDIFSTWSPELENFTKNRNKYLLYN